MASNPQFCWVMNLLEFRKFFAQHSGRYDLVDKATGADKGADVFIRAGSRYLDRIVDVKYAIGEQEIPLTIGQITANIDVRSVHQVWVKDAAETSINELERISLWDARELYSDSNEFEDIDQGAPLYYAIGVREVPNSPFRETVKRLIILPPTDAAVTLVVKGGIYHRSLDKDGDSNFWTLEEPMILLMASMLMLEMPYRNTQGMNDLEGALVRLQRAIEFDTVAEDQHESDHMHNSWRYQDEF